MLVLTFIYITHAKHQTVFIEQNQVIKIVSQASTGAIWGVDGSNTEDYAGNYLNIFTFNAC